ncbi:hypothetical protein [Nitrosovibrio sp. Nv4]|uniref:hypothetical protein n=1 Tax=Nitrosovibrio sp. Nv4 TaxID=1945880 RepID=UPI000BC5B1EC|nr:hypothetical protein [Nitrosovibrio sp. Nv4]SOD42314.1 Predicted transcriptional regulator [Nitrosovibrio sp. Nv4]
MRKTLILCGFGLIVVALLWGWHVSQLEPLPPVNVSMPAEIAPEVEDSPKVPVVIKAPVQVYSGGRALKKKLKLPDVVTIDPTKEVIASSQVKADERPQTITTIINTETGESETFVRRDPLPWLAWDTSGEVGAYVGIKNGQQAVRLQARQGIVQVKGLHLGLIGSVDQAMSGTAVVNGTDYFVGAGIWAKW